MASFTNNPLAKLDLTYLNDVHTPEQPIVSNLTLNRDGAQEGTEQSKLPKSAFDRLVLEKGHHSMIVSLIAQHFRDKKSTSGHREEFDIVKGKGKKIFRRENNCALKAV